MKLKNLIVQIAIITVIFAVNSCEKNANENKGNISFGANYHLVNCVSTVTIQLDDEELGVIPNPVDSITDCNMPQTINKEVSPGNHVYKAVISPESGTGCSEEIIDTVHVADNECKKVLIDYIKIFNTPLSCDKNVVVNSKEYQSTSNNQVAISRLYIDGNCLTVNYSSSGCDGNSWVVKLIDSGSVAESYPVQRFLKLSLKNNEVCDAVISKETSFNIEDLQVGGNKKVILNVEGESITYEY